MLHSVLFVIDTLQFIFIPLHASFDQVVSEFRYSATNHAGEPVCPLAIIEGTSIDNASIPNNNALVVY